MLAGATCVHVSPASVLLKSPMPSVPAQSVLDDCGSKAITFTTAVARPACAARHVTPLSSDFQTPPYSVPAYTVVGVVGSTAMKRTVAPSGPWLVQTLVPAAAGSAASSSAAAKIDTIRRGRLRRVIGPPHLCRSRREASR